MIDYTKTAEMHDTSETEIRAYFDRYPRSAKIVVSVCDGCTAERMLPYYADKPMCRSCTKKVYWENPAKRAEISAWMTRYWADPENRVAYAEKMAKHYNDPAYRELQSRNNTEYWAEKRRDRSESDDAQIPKGLIQMPTDINTEV